MKKHALILLLVFIAMLCGNRLTAQVEATDTSKAVMALVSGDSTDLRKLYADIRRQTQSGDKAALSDSYYELSVIYIDHSIGSRALKYLFASINLAEETGNKERLGWCYMWLGSFYKGDSSAKALKYLAEGNKIFQELGNKHGLGSIYNTYGDVYEHRGDLNKAHYYYFSSLNILRGGERKDLLWPYYNIGEVYAMQECLDSARVYYDSALAVEVAVQNRSGEAWIYNNIAHLLLKKKDYKEAERYSLSALRLLDSLGEPGGILNTYRNLLVIYEAVGDDKNVIKYYKLHNALVSTISNEESTRKIVQHQMQFDFDKEKELQQIEQQKKDLYTTIGVVVLVVIILIATFAFYFQRKSNNLKAALLSQKEHALTQKEMMMKEIHHRVKNNLQVTGTLLDLQLANIQDPAAKEAIKESISRLNTISLIHNQLYTNEQTSTLDFSYFATELHKQLNSLYGRAGQHINWRNQMSNLILDIDTAVPLGLIINELVTNSYKHAFNGEGWIKLTVKKDNDIYYLSYADSGPGLPGNVDIKKLNGLGMMIINSLCKQIGGSFEYVSGNNTFVVTFKDAAEMKKMA